MKKIEKIIISVGVCITLICFVLGTYWHFTATQFANSAENITNTTVLEFIRLSQISNVFLIITGIVLIVTFVYYWYLLMKRK